MVQYEYAIDKNGARINIQQAIQKHKYRCVECDNEMYAVNSIGNTQSPHFRHVSESTALHEGALHQNTKFLIYDYIKSFFDMGVPLYIHVVDKYNLTHHVNILEHATNVKVEAHISPKYRPDIIITGEKSKCAIEIIDTHPMSKMATRYAKDNRINVIKVHANEMFLDALQIRFNVKYNYLFKSAQKNIEFNLCNLEFDIKHLDNFKDFGNKMFDKINSSIKRFYYKKYKLDAFMFMEKKKNQFNQCMESVYTILDLYLDDSIQFLKKCSYEDDREQREMQSMIRNKETFVYKMRGVVYFKRKFDELAVGNPSFITWVNSAGKTFVATPPYDPERFYSIVKAQKDRVRLLRGRRHNQYQTTIGQQMNRVY